MAIPGQQTTIRVGVGCRAAAVLQPASRHRQELGWLGGRGDSPAVEVIHRPSSAASSVDATRKISGPAGAADTARPVFRGL
ncbi:hypothetical protein VTJ04DRAFT_2830 [Mycothermus thermophilus]|uniref:uncharacterized protein n=1 Tax=Humicola insolens TaxID=85995 RepID=UPI003743B925